jgi:pseudomonalisin
MKRKSVVLFAVGICSVSLFLHGLASGQNGEMRNPLSSYAKDRIIRPIDDERRVVLSGNRHPLAQPEFRLKPVPQDFPMERMVLVLNADAAQQAALDDLVAQQHDINSPYYHQWITPERYGELFGASEGDINTVVNWLQSHGMLVEEVAPGRRSIIFSGNAGQVTAAFHTRIQTYKVNGELHHANDSDPEIPMALASVVGGLVSLHDFRSEPMHVMPPYNPVPAPNFSSGASHYLTPADFAIIYNLVPLYQNLTDGSGQSIAIVGRSNVHMSDIRSFRTNFGLPTRDPQIILNGADPGVFDANEEAEAVLDVEWSGAIAKNATVKFVVSASTSSSDGTYLSAQYIVNHDVAPVMSMSFGLCEAALGSSGNSFINSLWQQAAAEGITVFVSSGDSGAAGCDSASAPSGTHGRGINGLCSSTYSVCVGGTQFDDTGNPSLYWSSFNTSSSQASAQSYIPEKVWNESGSSGLWSGGGGVSAIYSKPSWQTGTGVPADGKRDVPDISMTAAVHDGYLVYMNGGLMLLGGTSAAAPSLAGVMSLVVQSRGSAQGNANPIFYTLAARQRSGGAAVFHDTTTGGNTVPGVTGFNAAAGYDQASGLGSVDANQLVSHWSDGSVPPAPTFQLSAPVSVNLGAADHAALSVTVAISSGFNATIALSVGGLPTGVTASFASSTLSAPGSGTGVLNFTAALSVKAGSYPITITGTSGGTAKSITVSLVVTVPVTFTLSTAASSATLVAGSRSTLGVSTAISTGFQSAVNLTVTGQPAGLTFAFSPASIKSPGAGSSTLTISPSPTLAVGTYNLIINASGGGVTRTATLTLNITSYTLRLNATSVSLAPLARGPLTISTAALGGFNSAVTISASSLPVGITGSFNAATISAPGNGNVTFSLTRGSTAKVASSTVTITALGGGVARTATFTLNVTAK